MPKRTVIVEIEAQTQALAEAATRLIVDEFNQKSAKFLEERMVSEHEDVPELPKVTAKVTANVGL